MLFNRALFLILVSVSWAPQASAMFNWGRETFGWRREAISGWGREAVKATRTSAIPTPEELDEMRATASKKEEFLELRLAECQEQFDEQIATHDGSEGEGVLEQGLAVQSFMRGVLMSAYQALTECGKTPQEQAERQRVLGPTQLFMMYMAEIVCEYDKDNEHVVFCATIGDPRQPALSMPIGLESSFLDVLSEQEAKFYESAETQVRAFLPQADSAIYLNPSVIVGKNNVFFTTRHELNHILHDDVRQSLKFKRSVPRVTNDENVQKEQEEAFSRCFERRADILALCEPDGRINGDALRGAVQQFHDFKLIKIANGYVLSVLEKFPPPGVDTDQMREAAEDKIHPTTQERLDIVEELIGRADEKGYVAPSDVRSLLYDCDDCRATASDFFAEARAMSKRLENEKLEKQIEDQIRRIENGE